MCVWGGGESDRRTGVIRAQQVPPLFLSFCLSPPVANPETSFKKQTNTSISLDHLSSHVHAVSTYLQPKYRVSRLLSFIQNTKPTHGEKGAHTHTHKQYLHARYMLIYGTASLKFVFFFCWCTLAATSLGFFKKSFKKKLAHMQQPTTIPSMLCYARLHTQTCPLLPPGC